MYCSFLKGMSSLELYSKFRTATALFRMMEHPNFRQYSQKCDSLLCRPEIPFDVEAQRISLRIGGSAHGISLIRTREQTEILEDSFHQLNETVMENGGQRSSVGLKSIPRGSLHRIFNTSTNLFTIDRREAFSAPSVLISRGLSKLSPAVNHWLSRYKLDSSKIQGSGPRGRILKGDILSYIEKNGTKESKPTYHTGQRSIESLSSSPRPRILPQTVSDVALQSNRFQRQLNFKTQTPHIYTEIEFLMDELIKLRSQVNQMKNDTGLLSMTDFFVRAVVLSLKDVPEMNAAWCTEKEEIRLESSINIAVTVSSNNRLISPIIRRADDLSIDEISSRLHELVEKTQENQIYSDNSEEGFFSLLDLGMFGIRQFSAVISPPQICTLTIGAITKKFLYNRLNSQDEIPDESSTIDSNLLTSIRHVATATLSTDGRVVDVSVTQKFLNVLRGHIENPSQLFL